MEFPPPLIMFNENDMFEPCNFLFHISLVLNNKQHEKLPTYINGHEFTSTLHTLIQSNLLYVRVALTHKAQHLQSHYDTQTYWLPTMPPVVESVLVRDRFCPSIRPPWGDSSTNTGRSDPDPATFLRAEDVPVGWIPAVSADRCAFKDLSTWDGTTTTSCLKKEHNREMSLFQW